VLPVRVPVVERLRDDDAGSDLQGPVVDDEHAAASVGSDRSRSHSCPASSAEAASSSSSVVGTVHPGGSAAGQPPQVSAVREDEVVEGGPDAAVGAGRRRRELFLERSRQNASSCRVARLLWRIASSRAPFTGSPPLESSTSPRSLPPPAPRGNRSSGRSRQAWPTPPRLQPVEREAILSERRPCRAMDRDCCECQEPSWSRTRAPASRAMSRPSPLSGRPAVNLTIRAIQLPFRIPELGKGSRIRLGCTLTGSTPSHRRSLDRCSGSTAVTNPEDPTITDRWRRIGQLAM
jgi:hypothetical protein